MIRSLIVAALLALGLPAAADDYWQPHWQSRLFTVGVEADIVGGGGQIALGDSNSETFHWSAIPGCQVINAGFGGARMRQLAEFAEAIAPGRTPRVVHVMAGTNNLITDRASDPALQVEWNTMAADLHRIVVAFRAVGARVVLWPVPPVAQAHAPPGYIADRAHINAIIEAEFNANGGLAAQQVYWDWWWPGQITNAQGYALASAVMSDGVHLTAASQVSRYQRIDVWRQHIQSQGHAPC